MSLRDAARLLVECLDAHAETFHKWFPYWSEALPRIDALRAELDGGDDCITLASVDDEQFIRTLCCDEDGLVHARDDVAREKLDKIIGMLEGKLGEGVVVEVAPLNIEGFPPWWRYRDSKTGERRVVLSIPEDDERASLGTRLRITKEG